MFFEKIKKRFFHFKSMCRLSYTNSIQNDLPISEKVVKNLFNRKWELVRGSHFQKNLLSRILLRIFNPILIKSWFSLRSLLWHYIVLEMYSLI